MPQQHLDRLTSTDASFLHQEGPTSHMHIGAVLVFEGPPPNFGDYLSHVRSRLHLVPRYRQRLATPPLESGRPLWVDDPTFNLEYHIRHAALPSPGSDDQLFALAGRVASQQLDRSKPLWESWLVEGLENDRFALIFKTHHSLVDGVAGVDIATVLLDLAPARRSPPPDLEPWQPQPQPSSAELLLAGMRDVISTTGQLLTRTLIAAANPASSLALMRDVLEGIGEIVWAGLNPAPETPLNVEIGPHRRYTVVRQRLDDYKLVKDALGGTVNDVVLTVVSGALAEWLRSRGIRTEGLEMRALVPVSIRTNGERGTLGNRLTVMRGPLPVYIRDPVARLRFVRHAMDGLKESKQAVGATTLVAVNNLAPPTILAQASRLNFSTRLFNLIVTNIPGPQLPLYLLGRQLDDLYPVAFLPKNHALAVAIMSYNGAVDYGLLGDYDALADIDVIGDGIAAALDELLVVARGRVTAGRGTDTRGSGKRATGVRRSGTRAAGARGTGSQAQRAGGRAQDSNGQGARTARRATRRTAAPRAGDADANANGGPAPIIPVGRARPKSGPAADMRAKRSQGSKRRKQQ
ncbi:MAG: wax ester/triacylglycerol synthase family O-acyltransferase [Solirubrobacterales bacterium]|nr:wax ester/triacylglycerol synthase family O-acyltransferase [Solirubrobacterales bacterium]